MWPQIYHVNLRYTLYPVCAYLTLPLSLASVYVKTLKILAHYLLMGATEEFARGKGLQHTSTYRRVCTPICGELDTR